MTDIQRQQNAISTDDRLESLLSQAVHYAENAKSERTKKEYSTDWALFSEWCASMRLNPMPATAKTVAAYIVELANQGRKASTIQRKLSAIAVAHEASKHDSPTRSIEVKTVWGGLRKELGTAPSQKKALTVAQLRQMVEATPDSLIGIRDRALLLVAFAGAFRREELAAIDIEDISYESEGLRILVRQSKTDQEGAGQVVGIPYGASEATCPVRATHAWIDAAGIDGGAVFRSVTKGSVGTVSDARISGKDVARRIKKYAEAIGLDATRYAGHSTRRGLATEAARAGKSERDIMRQTRHKSTQMVRRYIEEGELFRDNVAGGIGL